MTSPHAPTPEAITPQGDRNSPHLTAVAERLAENDTASTRLQEPHPNRAMMPQLGLQQQQAKAPEPQNIKKEKHAVDGEQARLGKDGELGGNEKATGERAGLDEHAESKVEGRQEIKAEPERLGDAPSTMAVPLLETAGDSHHDTNAISCENADGTLDGPSNQQLLVDGRSAAEFVPTMGQRSAVQDDAAVATMPPRADQITESMGLFSGAIDNAAFMAYMQTPANFYGMDANGMDVNGPLSLPQTSADGLLALQMASTMNMNPFPFGETTLDPSPNISGIDTIVEDHHRVVSI